MKFSDIAYVSDLNRRLSCVDELIGMCVDGNWRTVRVSYQNSGSLGGTTTSTEVPSAYAKKMLLSYRDELIASLQALGVVFDA